MSFTVLRAHLLTEVFKQRERQYDANGDYQHQVISISVPRTAKHTTKIDFSSEEITRSCSTTSCFKNTFCECVCGVSVLSGAVHHVVLCAGAFGLHVGV